MTTPQSPLAEREALLVTWLDASIKDVNEKRRLNQRKASRLRIASLTFAGLATLLLGLKVDADQTTLFTNVAFVASVLVTFLTAIESYFNYRALWVAHERAKAEFFALSDRVRFFSGLTMNDTDRAQALSQSYAEYERIWGDLNETWFKARETKPLEFNQTKSGG